MEVAKLIATKTLLGGWPLLAPAATGRPYSDDVGAAARQIDQVLVDERSVGDEGLPRQKTRHTGRQRLREGRTLVPRRSPSPRRARLRASTLPL